MTEGPTTNRADPVLRALAIGRGISIALLVAFGALEHPSPADWGIIGGAAALQILITLQALLRPAWLPQIPVAALGVALVGVQVAASGGVGSEIDHVSATLVVLSSFVFPARRVAVMGALYTATLLLVLAAGYHDAAPGHRSASTVVTAATVAVMCTLVAIHLQRLVEATRAAARRHRARLVLNLDSAAPTRRDATGDLFDGPLQLVFAAHLETSDHPSGAPLPRAAKATAGGLLHRAQQGVARAIDELRTGARAHRPPDRGLAGAPTVSPASLGTAMRLTLVLGLIATEVAGGELPVLELGVAAVLVPWIAATRRSGGEFLIGLPALLDVAVIALAAYLLGDGHEHTHLIAMIGPALYAAVAAPRAVRPLLGVAVAGVALGLSQGLGGQSTATATDAANILGAVWVLGVAFTGAFVHRGMRRAVATEAELLDSRLTALLARDADAMDRAAAALDATARTSLADAEAALLDGDAGSCGLALRDAAERIRSAATALHPPAHHHGGLGPGLVELIRTELPGCLATADVSGDLSGVPGACEDHVILLIRDLLGSWEGAPPTAASFGIGRSGPVIELAGWLRHDDATVVSAPPAADLLRLRGAVVEVQTISPGATAVRLSVPLTIGTDTTDPAAPQSRVAARSGGVGPAAPDA